ncbi:MAG: hypothetical protein KF914_19430 [Rhizobiaceae bacterium]|nr:hypothetical protein [Rhizobiaceae bacterium]
MAATNGDDILDGTTGADTINALAGNDTIDAKTRPTAPGSGIDVVDGGAGDDTLVVICSGETKSVQLGAGNSPNFTVRSDSGNFYVDAYSIEKIKFTGGAGDDSINTGERGGTVNGGGGIDHWFANLSGLFTGITFTLGSTTSIAAAGLTSILGIERLTLNTGSGNDVIAGGAQADTINTGDGDDTIDARSRPAGGAAVDVVDGGADFDTLIVNASTETQSVQLGAGNSPSFTVRSTSGNFYVDAYNMERIQFTGGAGNDTINTGDRGGTVDGGGGTDHWIADLSALASNIVFAIDSTKSIAAAGLTAIAGLERLTINTGSGNDVITGNDQADTINTGAGDDKISARTRPADGAAIDVVDGGTGTDTLVVGASSETKSVTLSTGNSPNFSVRSTSGKYYIDAYNVEVINIYTGSGNDTINTGNRGGIVDGNGGIDHWLADLSAVTSNIVYALDTTTSIAAAGLTSLLDLDRITLTTGSGNDVITGNSQADTVNLGNGNDKVSLRTRPTAPGSGIDIADGGAGTDTLVVGASSETQAVTLSSGTLPTFSVRSVSGKFYIDAYNMELITILTGAGDDTLDTGDHGGSLDANGGTDHWLANLSAVTSNIVFTLGTTTAIAAAGLTSILDIERITLTTGSGNDTIAGGAQADTINTGNGDDTIDGKTRPSGGGAVDVVDGGLGTDTLVVNAAAETTGVQVSAGNSPNFSVRSTSGNFYLDAYSVEKLVFTGGSGNDSVIGRALADTISTGGGKDTISGGDGADTLDGGSDVDTLIGGRGADKLTGGTGTDLFDYNSVSESSVAANAMDTITDYAAGEDIDLSDIDANNLGFDGDQAFIFIGANAFHNVRGELRSVGGLFEADVNGDGTADFRVLIGNGATVAQTDFFL